MKAGQEAALSIEELTQGLADSFMQFALSEGRVRLRYVDLLCEMAGQPEARISVPALHALYGTIIEGLSNDFSERGVQICNLVLVRIFDYVKRQLSGAPLTEQLKEFGYSHLGDLLYRYQRIRSSRGMPDHLRRKARKAVVLSRVSAGADIAITSIIVQRLRTALPQAELVLIGPDHLRDFFYDLPRLRWIKLPYPRQGAFRERVMLWPQLVELINKEKKDLQGEMPVFDPDTRLTQLGLLPVASEQRTFYFSSRTNPWSGREPCLPELTNFWLTRLFGEESALSPSVFLSRDKVLAAATFCRLLRQKGTSTIVVINFGVGHNPEKRINDPFEEELLVAFLKAERNTIILLDSGGDSDEKRKVLSLLSALKNRGFSTDYLQEDEIAGGKALFSHGVIGFQGSLGMLGSLIKQADSFFGYDSCGQHLASALKIPAVIVFAGAPNPRFAARWRPPASSTRAVPVKSGAGWEPREIQGLVAKVIGLYREKGKSSE